jgi:hypothetical protein
MPAPIYLPRRVSTFERLIPYFMQIGAQRSQQKRRQKFLREEKAEGREYSERTEADRRKYEEELYQKRGGIELKDIEGMPGYKVMTYRGKSQIITPKTPKEIYQTITLQDPSNPKKKRTFFRNNPTVKDLMAKGHTEVKTPATSLTINQRGAALNEAKRQLPPANMTPKDKQTYNNLTRVAEQGTGPFSMFAATTNALLGGFGIDKLFGKKGFFPDTVESRQVLRTIKQMGKAALSNSPRFPIAEQKLVDRLFPDPDKFFTNPRTEAKKLAIIRDTLNERKKSNNDIIRHAIDPEEAKKARANNNEINRLFALMKGDDSAAPPSESQITDRDIDMMNELLKQGSK